MQTSNVTKWIREEENRINILRAIHQPMTASQISRRTGIPVNICSHVIGKFTTAGITACLNPKARNSRVYGLTELGIRCRQHLCRNTDQPSKEYDCPSVNWELYGWVCFNHREMVIKTLKEPMQPSAIKRTLRLQKPNVKISANNIRDVMRLFVALGIVQPVRIRKRAHPRYELTSLGLQLQQLLIQAEIPFSHNSSTHK